MIIVAPALLAWGLHVTITALIVGPAVEAVARRNARHRTRAMAGDAPAAEHPPVAPHAGTRRLLAVAAAVHLVQMQALMAPKVGPFADLTWNWQGKLISLAVAVAFVAASSVLKWRDVGITVPRPGSWRPVLTIAAAAVVLQAVGGSMSGHDLTVETVLYQATMPGLEEELLFRGVLWALIDRALPRRTVLWGAQVGWGLVITTLVFGLAHGVVVDEHLGLSFAPSLVVATGVFGFVAGWVRARAASIWPAVVLHGAVNVSGVVLGA